MSEPQQPKSTEVSNLAVTILQTIVGGFIVGAFWYYFVGLLHNVDVLKGWSNAITWTQKVGMVVIVVGGMIGNLLERRDALAARKADEKVAEAVKTLQDGSPGRSVADISMEELSRVVGNTKVSKEHLERLFEQRKDRVLIDDAYFDPELIKLLVEYLQPLPRNAKRLMNRFRVNLLVAHKRGLLTTDPKVTPQQIGKWLVMSERWPQLSRSLSAAPDKMTTLEAASAAPVTASLKSLAPAYAKDEDLHRFLRSNPPLAGVLTRLVNFGGDQASAAGASGANARA